MSMMPARHRRDALPDWPEEQALQRFRPPHAPLPMAEQCLFRAPSHGQVMERWRRWARVVVQRATASA